jgi:hypothetical protein
LRVGIVPGDVPDKTMRIQTVIALFERYRLIVRRRSWRRTVVDLPWPPLGGDLFGDVGGDVIGISVGNVFGIVGRNVVEGGVDEDLDRSAFPCRKPFDWPVGDIFGNAGGGAIGIVVGNVVDWRIFGVVDWRVDRDRTAAVVGSIDVDRGPCRNRSNSCNGLFPSLSSPKGSCDAGDGILSCFSGGFKCQIWGRIGGH